MCPGHGVVHAAVMRRSLLIAATLPLVVGIAACGDDDNQAVASARTTEAYCADLRAVQDDEGPTEAFFAEHPDPTLEDWAAGLPDIIARAKEGRDRFAAIRPSDELADERRALVDSLNAVIASFEAGLDKARAGDQAAFDAEEQRNQGENVPALESAFQALTKVCGGAE
jgi:hypothetical protein